jgi:hypothetical protein
MLHLLTNSERIARIGFRPFLVFYTQLYDLLKKKVKQKFLSAH